VSDLLRTLLPALRSAARRALRAEDLDLVVVHNTGAIPPVRSASNGAAGQPGFNVLVAERGRPIYFCKCRPAGDPALAHEAAVGEILSREPSTAAHVPAFHFERGGVMDILVVRRLSGRPYHELLVTQSTREWLSSVEQVIGVVEGMATYLGAAIPALRGPAALRVSEEGRWALAALQTEQGLAARRADALARALAGGDQVAPVLQHGDLWPPNVLVDGSSWYILDLDLFGRIRVPLYDLFHMLCICSEVRQPEPAAGRPWAQRLVDGDPSEAGARDLVRRTAHRHGLSSSAAFAAFVYYVVDITARVKARGAWTASWRAYLAQSARLADLIIEGAATPERLFTSDRV
jgi:hypothetical protein